MIKRIVYFIIILIVLFILSFFTHNYVLGSSEIVLCYSLFSVYLFHVVSAVVVYFIVELTAEYVPSQAGYGYLASVFIKLGFFVLIFKVPVFTNDNLSMAERLSLIIPLFLFLIYEALATAKLLNTK